MTVLVSPTEPTLLKHGRQSHSIPEQYGVDYLAAVNGELHGIQRKTIDDLLASLHDGRLQKGLAQMQALTTRMLIIEGDLRWTADGQLVHLHSRFSRAQLHGLLISIQYGYDCGWINTTSLAETDIVITNWFQFLVTRSVTLTLTRRPKCPYLGSIAQQRWLLQGLPRCGPVIAQAILDTVGMPITWNVARERMVSIDGVGSQTLDKWEHVIPRRVIE